LEISLGYIVRSCLKKKTQEKKRKEGGREGGKEGGRKEKKATWNYLLTLKTHIPWPRKCS
jgi:hypothetical protein